MKKSMLLLMFILVTFITVTACGEDVSPYAGETAARTDEASLVLRTVPPVPAQQQTEAATSSTTAEPTTLPLTEATVEPTTEPTTEATIATTARTTARTTAPTTARTTAAPVSQGELRGDIAHEILALVNAERAAHNIPAVSWSDSFAETARIRSHEIPIRFEADHRRPDGRAWHTAVTEAGINYRTIGENMARGGHSRDGAAWYTPQKVMESWMNSPGHRENILNENFELLGVGAFDLDGTRYYVQHFGAIR